MHVCLCASVITGKAKQAKQGKMQKAKGLYEEARKAIMATCRTPRGFMKRRATKQSKAKQSKAK